MHINVCRWRSFNAFWGIVSQEKMETIMDAMVNKSRLVAGKPTSLLDLGYNHVGLDGGWNYCYPVRNDLFPCAKACAQLCIFSQSPLII